MAFLVQHIWLSEVMLTPNLFTSRVESFLSWLDYSGMNVSNSSALLLTTALCQAKRIPAPALTILRLQGCCFYHSLLLCINEWPFYLATHLLCNWLKVLRAGSTATRLLWYLCTLKLKFWNWQISASPLVERELKRFSVELFKGALNLFSLFTISWIKLTWAEINLAASAGKEQVSNLYSSSATYFRGLVFSPERVRWVLKLGSKHIIDFFSMWIN